MVVASYMLRQITKIPFKERIMSIRKSFLVGALSLLWAAASHAVPIVGVNDPANNTAEFTWEVVGGELVISIENTCNFNCVITGFAFTITDDVTGATALVSVEGTLDNSGWTLTTSVTGCNSEECVITGRNLNGGDPQDGIAAGSTGIFTFGGTFADPTNITDILVRFQQTGADGEGSDRGYVCQVNCKPPEVTEPASLGLLGLGLLAFGLSRRRRNLG